MSDIKTALSPIVGAIVSSPIPADTTHAYFDPLSYIDDRLEEPALKAKLTASAVWAFDNRIIDTAIGLYFELRKENPEVGRDIGLLMDAFKEQVSSEAFWGLSRATLLCELVVLQPAWHGVAYRLNAANNYPQYAPRSIEELVLNAKPRTASPQTRKNLEANASFVARMAVVEPGANASKEAVAKYDEEVAALAKEAFDNLIATDKQRAENNVDFRKEILPAIRAFVDAAVTKMGGKLGLDTNTEVHFHTLDVGTQLALCRSISTAIPRVTSDLAPILDTTSYTMVLGEAYAARKVFNRVCENLALRLERERTSD